MASVYSDTKVRLAFIRVANLSLTFVGETDRNVLWSIKNWSICNCHHLRINFVLTHLYNSDSKHVHWIGGKFTSMDTTKNPYSGSYKLYKYWVQTLIISYLIMFYVNHPSPSFFALGFNNALSAFRKKGSHSHNRDFVQIMELQPDATPLNTKTNLIHLQCIKYLHWDTSI